MSSKSKLLNVTWAPSPRMLRQFSWLSAAAFAFLAWRFYQVPVVFPVLLGASLAILLVGQIWPSLLRPVFIGLTLLTLPIGLVVGELIMLMIYFGQLLPISLVFRLVGRDAMRLQIDRTATSYWTDRAQVKTAESYFRQF